MSEEIDAHLRVVVAGAALDTGNLGVTALGMSTVAGFRQRNCSVVVLDNGVGSGPIRLSSETAVDQGATREGAWYSRRIWRPESLMSMDWASRLGATKAHHRLRAWQRSDAMVDVSGGDSFSDIYGAHRFRTVVAPKAIALRLGIPVVLLPQTYGPFRDQRVRAEATEIVANATQCWARDERSFEILQGLLGTRFDPLRHRLGVDVAFALPRVAPRTHEELFEWIEDGPPVLGVNVSGLIASAAPGVSGLCGSEYLGATSAFVDWAVGEGHRVVLVPHVIGDAGESDEVACRAVVESLSSSSRTRVRVLRGFTHPGHVKYVISKLDWFTGARMHSTIASLSTQVPTLATAYSDKFEGVFAACGASEAVVDLRRVTASELLASWQEAVSLRHRTRQVLRDHVPAVVDRAGQQFDDILAAIGGT